jgi:precorrin-2/cobalt-factor-2 C20-methyltransferase
MSPAKKGTIYGVGVGPGDPELITLKAVRAMRGAKRIVCPAPRDENESLALSIAREHCPAGCEIVEKVFPMSEVRSEVEQSWEEAAQTLLETAEAGHDAVFITLGDATFYSTWGYVQRILKKSKKVAVVTVPGITAMSACAASAGRPLAEGRVPLVVWPGDPSSVEGLSKANYVFMKASKHLPLLAEKSKEWNYDVVAFENCSLEGERRTTDLGSWEGNCGYFTTVIAWSRPSKGKP